MERLTRKNWRNLDPWETCGQDNYCKRGCHEQGGCANGCIVPRSYARLAAYEDSGLEPQDIISAVDMAKIACALHELNAYKDIGPIDHLRDLLQAENEGRLVVLPCKVVCGTVIWWADSNFYADPIKCEVSSFGIYTGPDGDIQVWMNCYVYGPTPMSKSFRMSSIDKTVFLTREEAEAALELKGGEG